MVATKAAGITMWIYIAFKMRFYLQNNKCIYMEWDFAAHNFIHHNVFTIHISDEDRLILDWISATTTASAVAAAANRFKLSFLLLIDVVCDLKCLFLS